MAKLGSKSTTAAAVVVAFTLGVAAPAAAHEAAKKVSGSTLKANSVTGKQVKESTLHIVPKAKLALKAKVALTAKALPPLVWHNLTLRNDWTLVGTVQPSYAVDAQGIVHLRGVMAGTIDTEAFVLPVKARPHVQIALMNEISLNATGVLLINSDGAVYPQTKANTGTNNYDSLDGVSYPAG
jgi:hypothetical protein